MRRRRYAGGDGDHAGTLEMDKIRKVPEVGPPNVWGPHGPKGWCSSPRGLAAHAPKAHAGGDGGGQP